MLKTLVCDSENGKTISHFHFDELKRRLEESPRRLEIHDVSIDPTHICSSSYAALPSSSSRPGLGLGRVGRLDLHAGRLTRTGHGSLLQGAGIFNEQTAIADSINADTMMRWNDYIYQANTEAARGYVARRRENSANIRTQNDAITTRIRDNPTVRDIEMGDALNAAVNQLTDPRVSSAALRLPPLRSKQTLSRKSRFETLPRRS